MLCRNPGPLKDTLLGDNGHLERMSAWTHLVGAAAFAVYSVLRSFMDGFDKESTAGILTALSTAMVAVTFGVSTIYHIYGSVEGCSALLRVFDHHAVVVSLSMANTADAAIATASYHNVPWQTVADAGILGVVVIAYFSYRRLLLPREETRFAWGDCSLGLWRIQHGDKEHGGLRSSSYLILSFMFLLYIPAALRNLNPYAVGWYFLTTTLGIFLIVGSRNVIVYPDTHGSEYELTCHNKRLLHPDLAWWHLATLVRHI